MPPTNETKGSDPPNGAQQKFAGSFLVAIPSNTDCGDIPVMDKVKSKRKASGKTGKRKGTSQRKKRKVVATNNEPSVQSTDQHDPKQNVVAAMNSLG